MNNNKKSFIESLFYDNKFLAVFCVLISIIIWVTVKINYSAETSRTVSDVKINVSALVAEGSDYKAFVDESELYADVEVYGKAYNINSYALTKDDIVIEVTGSYSDSPGYRVLNLTARLADAAAVTGVTIKSLNPSTIKVYYDKETKATLDVVARLTNDFDVVAADNFSVGQPVPSVSNVTVNGPATIVNKLTKVYFDAAVLETDLPLSASKVVPAEINFEVEKEDYKKYLTCEEINDESNPATVTVPIYISKNVATQVNFINQPSYYTANPLKVTIDPEIIRISYNSDDNVDYEAVTIGTIDFRKLSNKVNEFDFEVDPNLPVVLSDEIDGFRVSVDLSSMKKKTVAVNSSKIVLTNQKDGFSYDINIKESGFDSIVVIGPAESLEKITGDDIQIEINVSALSPNLRSARTVDVNNISIINPDVNDCWVYGNYTASITVDEIAAAE